MPQSSAPIVGVNLSDSDWRDSFGDEAGVLGDLDGTAYKVTLPTGSDVAQIGSTTQRSMARVAGFIHRIPSGETESLTIPVASGSTRTDVIALEYNPSFTGSPGPVRVVRIAGSGSAIPTYDASAPGVEQLPLWAITRVPGQALSQATLVDLRVRLSPTLDVPPTVALPLSSPLGTIARYHNQEFHRELNSGGVPVWVRASATSILGTYQAPFANAAGSYGNDPTEITNFTIPDPGVPYRAQITMGFEAGSTQDGTRWDFHAGYGGSGNSLVTSILASSISVQSNQYRTRHHNVTGQMSDVLTGTRTWRIVADRFVGGALGEVTALNRLFRVTYWAA